MLTLPVQRRLQLRCFRGCAPLLRGTAAAAAMDIARRVESMERFLTSQLHLHSGATAESTRAMVASLVTSIRTCKLGLDDAALINEKVAASTSDGLPPPNVHGHSGMTIVSGVCGRVGGGGEGGAWGCVGALYMVWLGALGTNPWIYGLGAAAPCIGPTRRVHALVIAAGSLTR